MTPLISLKIETKLVINIFDKIADNIVPIRQAVLEQAQTTLLKHIKRLAPRNTGSYADSWKKGTINEGSATIITDQGNLYILLEFTGADPWKRQRKPPEKPFVFTAKDGSTVFTFKINHPGFAKIPHAQPAMDLTLREMKTFLKDEIRKLFE